MKKVKITTPKVWDGNRAIYNAPIQDRLIKLTNSIKRKGQLEPLVLSSDGYIISGHTRFEAMKLLNRRFVNVNYCSIHSTDQEFTEMVVEFNNHRSKPDQEKINEIKIKLSPDEYIKKSYESRHEGK